MMQISLKLEVIKVITLEFSLSSDKEKKKDDNSKGWTQPSTSNTAPTKQ